MRLLVLILMFSLSVPAFASFGNDEKLSNAEQESRAVELFKEIRCLVCEGESLAESNAELAGDMRILIREKIAAGETNDEIREYLIFRYGDGILQKPPFKPSTYLLWLTPVGLLAIGVILILSKTKIHKKNGRRRTK